MPENTFIYISMGLIFVVINWLLAYYYTKNTLTNKLSNDIKNNYTAKSQYDFVISENIGLKKELAVQRDFSNIKDRELAVLQNEHLSLQKYQDTMMRDNLALQTKFKSDFESLSQKILDEKTQKFTETNFKNITQILSPLSTKIEAFESSINEKHISEIKDRSALQKEIEYLRALNTQLSSDANNLASALKGDNKTQGDWGEYRLQMLLEKSGLKKDIHFKVQPSFKDDEGKIKRPDFIVSLPDDKSIIIDSKVSLKAYDNYLSATTEEERKNQTRLLLESIRLHIRDLNSKKYDELYAIDTPNYVLMFIPLEPALNLAAEFDKDLFLSALEKNIVLVSTSTLLATLRTISFIWTQDTQQKNVQEIAKQSGLLYDKLHGFITDLEIIGEKLDNAQNAYGAAFNKLLHSSKKGDTLLGRAEKLKNYGAITKKTIKVNSRK